MTIGTSTTTSPNPYSTTQLETLTRRGIDADYATLSRVLPVRTPADLPEGCPKDYWTEVADEAGRAFLPGLVVEWRSPITGIVSYQLRPDNPPLDADGNLLKYVFPKGWKSVIHAARPPQPGDGQVAMLVEGTFKMISAARYAPFDMPVYGIAGCQSWMKDSVPVADLVVFQGKTVLVALDADAATNRGVFDAGVKLAEALEAVGAAAVWFIRVPGGKDTGIDDVLGELPEEFRRSTVANLVTKAMGSPKADKRQQPAKTRPPERKKRDSDDQGRRSNGTEWFDQWSGKLLVRTISEDILSKQPAAVTPEQKVAIYKNGVYRFDGSGFLRQVAGRLDEQFAPAHVKSIEMFSFSILADQERFLPDRMELPLCNVPAGMIDLRTGTLYEHDPELFSSVQFPIAYDPDATAPYYEWWLEQQAGADQIDDLEETVAMMLDPSVTPTKALFLFGKSRSGKGTYLRLLKEAAGRENMSGLTLHQLSTDGFASANLYGKTLNVSGDLSAAHIDDVSMFKMATGEDIIHANRKYGGQFDFTNRALFAFGANEPPTIGEQSQAYFNRIKPFFFDNTYAGREDPLVEARLLQELPGIFNRWIAAWQRRNARGFALATNPVSQVEFEIATDKVRRFVNECCDVLEVTGGGTADSVMTTTQVFNAYKRWCDLEAQKSMARGKMVGRLGVVPGVADVRSKVNRARGWNLRLRKEEAWGKPEREVITVTVTPPPAYPGGPGQNQTNGATQGAGSFGTMINSELPAAPSKLPALLPSNNEVARTGVEMTDSSTPGGQGGQFYPHKRKPGNDVVFNEVIPQVTLMGSKLPALPGEAVFAGQGASSATPPSDPLPVGNLGAFEGLLDVTVPAYDHRPCEDCGRSQERVPPAFLIYACPLCHPATFERN